MKQALASIADDKLYELVVMVSSEFDKIQDRFYINEQGELCDNEEVIEAPVLQIGEHRIEAVTFYDDEDNA